MTRSDSRTASEANRPYRPTGASLAAIILATLCFGAVMLLHLARGHIDPMRQVMSEYANGSHGPVMTVVFYSFALSTFALAFRLRRALNRRGVAKLIVGLLTVAGIGLLAAGIFEVERPLVPDTVEEMIHSNATVTAFTLLIASMLLLALVCRIDPRWWAFRWTAAALALAALLAAVATPLSAHTGWSGAVQRALGLTVVVWILLTALHVRTKAFKAT